MAYNSNKNETDNTVLTNVLSVISKSKNHTWTGTMTDLQVAMCKKSVNGNLPKSASSLRMVLNRIINRLRSRGVSVKFGRTPDAMRTRFVEFVSK
jgi:hypothetical protein